MAATNNIFPRLSRRTSAMVLIGVMCIAIAVLVLINIFAPEAPADQDISLTQDVSAEQGDSWVPAQTITLETFSIGVGYPESFTRQQNDGTVTMLHTSEDLSVVLSLSEHACSESEIVLCESVVQQNGDLLDAFYGSNEQFMVPGSLRRQTVSLPEGTAWFMAAEDNPLYGNAISGMAMYYHDGRTLRIGYQNNALTSDELLAEMQQMISTLTNAN